MLTPSNPKKKAVSAHVQKQKAVSGDVQKRKVCNLAVTVPLYKTSHDLYSFGNLHPAAKSDVIHNQRSMNTIGGTDFDGYVVYKHRTNSWRKVPRVTDVNYTTARSTFPPVTVVPPGPFELK